MATAELTELFIAEVEAFGGAERSVLALSRWLHEHGVANRLLTYHDHVGLERHVSHPMEVLQLKPQGGGRAKIAALRKHFGGQTRQPHLQCNGFQESFHATLAGARGFQCLMHDTKSLFGDEEQRSLMHRARLWLSEAVIGYGLRSGGVTIVTSEYLQAECLKDFRVDAKIARMGGLTPEGGFHERPFAGKLNLFSVSRIEQNKRIDWMLRSLAALEKAAPALSARADWRLDLAGKGSLIEPLQRLAAELGLQHRVHFLGFVPDDELQRLFREAHLFLMPAVQGFGIPAVEALAAGMPVLLHRESGVSDILRETPWATVFEGGEASMAPALNQAIDGVIAGCHLGAQLPPISSENEWAALVARYCGWV